MTYPCRRYRLTAVVAAALAGCVDVDAATRYRSDGTFAAAAGSGLDHDGRDRSPPPPPGTVFVSTADPDGSRVTVTTAATSDGGDLGTVAATRP